MLRIASRTHLKARNGFEGDAETIFEKTLLGGMALFFDRKYLLA